MLAENLKYDKRVFPRRFLNPECIPTVLFMQGTLQLLGPHGATTQYEYFGLIGIMLASGIERCQVDLGFEQDRGKRFALWAMLYLLGCAPDPEAVFDKADDRDSARNFMDLLAASEGDGVG